MEAGVLAGLRINDASKGRSRECCVFFGAGVWLPFFFVAFKTVK
jgi:hypothetical protein